MDSVFKNFGVCDDVADMIARKVHKGYQTEINKHISVMVAWNMDFDYWKFFNSLVPTRQLVQYEREDIKHSLGNVINYISKPVGSYDKDRMNELLSPEQYMKYVWSGKKIFSLGSIPRISFIYMIQKQRIDKIILEFEIFKDSWYILGEAHRLNVKSCYERAVKHSLCRVIHSSNTIVLSSSTYIGLPGLPRPKNFPKKTLIAYLNQNGDPRKLNNKKKSELWQLIYKCGEKSEKPQKTKKTKKT